MRFLVAILLLSSLFTSGCAKSASSEDVPLSKESSGVGPFDLKTTTETGAVVANSFSIDIRQSEGAVDFYTASAAVQQYYVFESYSTKVTGCNATEVKVTPVWYASESSSSPVILTTGDTMLSTPATRGRVRVVFQNLQGCTHLEFSMNVRQLQIGVLSPTIESRLGGTWNYGTSPGLTISLFVGASRVGWLESQGVNYTCDTQIYPQNSTEADGGWLVSSGGMMLCRYRLSASDPNSMTLNCFGKNGYGCTLPKNFQFRR